MVVIGDEVRRSIDVMCKSLLDDGVRVAFSTPGRIRAASSLRR